MVLAKLHETQVLITPLTTSLHSSSMQPPVQAQDHTPLTTNSLMHQGEDLQQATNLNLPPEFQENLKLVLKGDMAQAISGEWGLAELGNSRASEKA